MLRLISLKTKKQPGEVAEETDTKPSGNDSFLLRIKRTTYYLPVYKWMDELIKEINISPPMPSKQESWQAGSRCFWYLGIITAWQISCAVYCKPNGVDFLAHAIIIILILDSFVRKFSRKNFFSPLPPSEWLYFGLDSIRRLVQCFCLTGSDNYGEDE